MQTTEDMLSESPWCNDVKKHFQCEKAFSEKRSESSFQRLMQKYQYFEWGSTLILDGFKMIIF